MKSNFSPGTVFHMDNLDALRGMNSETLESDRLGYWAKVIMLDPRFCGATGTGAYWAVASECVNEIAVQILRERSLLRRMQLVMQYNAERQEQERAGNGL